jgi:hypothetical protein
MEKTNCPLCGCFNGHGGASGYEPGADEFAKAWRAAKLIALVVDQYDQHLKVEHRDYEEMRELVKGLGLLFDEQQAAAR